MFRSTGNFDKILDKATSHLLMEPDWPSILQLCDLIRQHDIQPRYALTAVKKKLFSTNQHTALYALLTLESLVKNCGTALHEELTTRSYCETLYELAKTTPHENVRQKLLELIQAWNFAFRKNPKYQALKDTMNTMKADGYKFPTLRESDAMFSADTAPEWADGDVCHRCRVQFSILQRKHHCRACGQVFCGQCTSQTTTLPKYGIEKEVRVCDACYEQVTRSLSSSSSMTTTTTSMPTIKGGSSNNGNTKGDKQENDLPIEYLNSSLAQQSQSPPRKSDEELREEEELQLALAISQSEAEAKEKEREKFKLVNTFKTPIEQQSLPPPPQRSPSPTLIEEQTNPELARYLNRSYWESINQTDNNNEQHNRVSSPSAPLTISDTKIKQQSPPQQQQQQQINRHENGVIIDNDLEDFQKTLKSQLEIFINRMKSNSSRGRSIANDTSVQTLFMNITAMHSQLLRYIQQFDDRRLHYERLQDKLTQVKDARAALDDLRQEHREKLRREAEEAERQRQLLMAQKLEIMRKKKQEYLQYQRQLALQRIQEQEREMQIRQEHQKQQYLMGYMNNSGSTLPPPSSSQTQMPPNTAPQPYAYHQFHGQPPMVGPPPGQPINHPQYQQIPNYGTLGTMVRPMPMPGMPLQQQQPPLNLPQSAPMPQQDPRMMAPPPQHPQQQQQQQPPPIQQQQQPAQIQEKEEAQTAELISFD